MDDQEDLESDVGDRVSSFAPSSAVGNCWGAGGGMALDAMGVRLWPFRADIAATSLFVV
jgi:hypothetical protein